MKTAKYFVIVCVALLVAYIFHIAKNQAPDNALKSVETNVLSLPKLANPPAEKLVIIEHAPDGQPQVKESVAKENRIAECLEGLENQLKVYEKSHGEILGSWNVKTGPLIGILITAPSQQERITMEAAVQSWKNNISDEYKSDFAIRAATLLDTYTMTASPYKYVEVMVMEDAKNQKTLNYHEYDFIDERFLSKDKTTGRITVTNSNRTRFEAVFDISRGWRYDHLMNVVADSPRN